MTTPPPSDEKNMTTTSLEVSEMTSEAYRELRSLAARFLSRERNHHTLTPTALVHEAYCRLEHAEGQNWVNREHFMATASTTLRRILVDYARARNSQKRPSARSDVTLERVPSPHQEHDSTVNMLAFDEALKSLGTRDARKARIVELKLFGGLSGKEISQLMGLSESVISDEWRSARDWIAQTLMAGDGRADPIQ